tara:strand:- start:2434 stop:3276 length:843 start_codon:yes stop_codon:yes gene_type:complete
MKIGYITLALELKKRGFFKDINEIYDLGTKELRISFNDLKNKFKEYNIKFNSNKFIELKKFPKGKRISTKFFWQNIGINNYFCSDINNEKKSKFLDLNFKSSFKKQYELVNDFGNNEHVFNVTQAYENMYNLCKKNGYMWIVQSLYNGNGFFNFDPSYFEGMAAANNLSITHSAFVVNQDTYKQFFIPCDKELLKSVDLNNIINIDMTFIFKKNTNKKFRFYYQYNLNNKSKPFKMVFDHHEHFAEKFYVPSKSKKELKSLAKNGDKTSINWFRANKIKF